MNASARARRFRRDQQRIIAVVGAKHLHECIGPSKAFPQMLRPYDRTE
jgi:hypothetical protein